MCEKQLNKNQLCVVGEVFLLLNISYSVVSITSIITSKQSTEQMDFLCVMRKVWESVKLLSNN